jgi:hypothetical protein
MARKKMKAMKKIKNIKKVKKPKIDKRKVLKDLLRPIVQELFVEAFSNADKLPEPIAEMVQAFDQETAQTENNQKAVEIYQAARRGEQLVKTIKGVIDASIKAKALKSDRLSRTKAKVIGRVSDDKIPDNVKEELEKIRPLTRSEYKELYNKLLEENNGDVDKVYEILKKREDERIAYKKKNVEKLIKDL